MFKKFAAALIVGTMLLSSGICLAHGCNGQYCPRYGCDDENYDNNNSRYCPGYYDNHRDSQYDRSNNHD